MIEGDGFFSELGQKAAHQIVSRHARSFCSLERTICELRSFISSQEMPEQKTEEDQQKIISLVLTTRILEISEAALLVMKNGMSNEANTLFRVFLDAYFVFGNICTDASFVANYFKSDESARLKLINAAKKHDSELFKSINGYASNTLKDDLQKKIAEEKIRAFNSYAYAENIGCSQIYDSMYRITSGNLHTTPRSLEKYVDVDEMGNILSIKDHPLEGDIPQRVYDVAYFLIKVLSGIKEVFGSLDKSEIQSMLDGLTESTKDYITTPPG